VSSKVFYDIETGPAPARDFAEQARIYAALMDGSGNQPVFSTPKGEPNLESAFVFPGTDDDEAELHVGGDDCDHPAAADNLKFAAIDMRSVRPIGRRLRPWPGLHYWGA
jgi:hypothetical protein